MSWRLGCNVLVWFAKVIGNDKYRKTKNASYFCKMIGEDIQTALEHLNKGDLVAIPTETVYGLAGNALNADAIAKVYATKNRPSFNPLIVHVANFDEAKKYVLDFPEDAEKLAQAFWPGPLTLLLKKNNLIPDVVTAGSELVAIRVPNHPKTLELLSSLEFPLVAPSANPYQFISPTEAKHVEEQLGDKIPYVLDGGACKLGIESTIVGFVENEPIIFRLGSLTRDKIGKEINKTIRLNTSDGNTVAPGMQKLHYAPSKKFFLGNLLQLTTIFKSKKLGVLSFSKPFKGSNIVLNKVLSPTENIAEAGANLFAYLHELEKANVEAIVAERLPSNGIGNAINDRLERAAGN